MNTELCVADEHANEKAALLLAQGELVGIPTETVYGLAANAFDEQAVAKIFEAKGRPQDNPLIVHISDLEMLDDICEEIPQAVYTLAEKFWPGPLTIIIPKSDKVPFITSGGLQTVAVRMPSHPVAKDIIARCKLPLAAPSANLSGSPSPTTARHVAADMNGRIPLIVDGGDCLVGVESTVITLCTPTPTLLRPGYITQEQLEQALDCKVELSGAILDKLAEGETASSPGMKYKHYSPKAEVIIVEGTPQAYCTYVQAQDGAWALCFEEDKANLNVPCITYGSAKNAQQQAHRLFTALRELDEAGATTVYAHCPQKTGVSMAVYNRLLRAAAFRVIKV